MRDGWVLTARLLLRPDGIAGLLSVAGGALLVVAAATGWFDVRSEVALLGHGSEETIASWRPLPRDPAGWVLAALGLTGIVTGARLALDRPVPRTLPVLAVVAASAALVGAGIALRPPGVRTIAPARAQELALVAEQLPAGVDHALRVTLAGGPLVAALGVVLLAVGAIGARDT